MNDLKARLRVATADVHEKLHGHAGLAAVASGTIGISDYRSLLSRLRGFHQPFDALVAEAARGELIAPGLGNRRRAAMIEADLLTLGLSRAAIARLPICNSIYRPSSKPAFLGALYVIEGSTLGGAQLARALAPLFDGAREGRRFFLGYGANNGSMWRAFLEQLDVLSGDPGAEDEAIASAVATFNDFDAWINGWRAVDDMHSIPADALNSGAAAE